MLKASLVLMLGILCGSCAPQRDSPFSDQLFHGESLLNASAISSVGNVEADGKIRIALMADAHQNYVDLDKVIRQINATGEIDFVANLGDFTNSGFNLEYDQFLDSYLNLRWPAITVLGNHDAIGAGHHMFERVFGEVNFFFESSSHRYIFFHSANLEYPKEFSADWLLARVNESTKPVIVFTHINPRDDERYFDHVKAALDAVVQNGKTQMMIYGHDHVYVHDNVAGTVMLQVPRVQGGQWLLLDIQGTNATLTIMKTGGVVSDTLKP